MPMFKIYVGNLDPRTTVEALKPYFEPFGEAVDEIILVMDEQGEPRGFAIVLFRDPQLGQLAVETLTGKKINGREIQINEAVKKGKRVLPVEEKAPRTSPLGPRAFPRPGTGGGFRPGAPRPGDSRPSGMASSRPGFGASAGGASSRFNRNPRRAPGAAGGPSSPMSTGSSSASGSAAIPGAEQGANPSASAPGVTPSAGTTNCKRHIAPTRRKCTASDEPTDFDDSARCSVDSVGSIGSIDTTRCECGARTSESSSSRSAEEGNQTISSS